MRAAGDEWWGALRAAIRGFPAELLWAKSMVEICNTCLNITNVRL